MIHVGAHLGEEVEAYFASGFQRAVLIEANPGVCLQLEARFREDPRVQVFSCAISGRTGPAALHIHTSRSGNTEPASLLPMKQFNRIVKTLSTPRSIEVDSYTLDDFFAHRGIDPRDFSLLNLDIQGAELQALQGAPDTLGRLAAVIAEVNLIELYAGSALEDQVVQFMHRHGFRKDHAVYHSLYDEKSSFPAWGECLFLKTRASSGGS